MKRKNIEINHIKILERIYTHTYYTGESRKAAGAPPHFAARMQASNSDKAALTHHIRLALSEVATMLTRYLGLCTTKYHSDTQSTIFTIETPLNYPHECMEAMGETIENYAVMRTLAEWLTQNKPDEAAAAAEEAQISTLHLRELMSTRKRPTTEHHNHDNNIEL